MHSARTRRPIVGVMGSGSEAYEERAGPLGAGLAELGVHLLTGGGSGVMTSVSRAFAVTPDREGSVLGILPADPESSSARGGYPNPWVDIPIHTHLPLTGEQGLDPMSRNHINVLSSDVIVALPGHAGTSSEVQLAVAYARPVIAFLSSRSEIPDLPDSVQVSDDLDEILEFVRMFAG